MSCREERVRPERPTSRTFLKHTPRDAVGGRSGQRELHDGLVGAVRLDELRIAVPVEAITATIDVRFGGSRRFARLTVHEQDHRLIHSDHLAAPPTPQRLVHDMSMNAGGARYLSVRPLTSGA